MARTTTGVDVGRRGARFLRGSWKDGTFHATDFAVVRHQEADLASIWAAIELPFQPRAARVGLTGRDVNVRYTQVPRVNDWQLRKLMRFEVEEIGDQSGSEVASDFNLLPSIPEIEGEDVVLLAMARESLLVEHAEGLARRGGKLDAFTPNSLALYQAWLRFGAIEDETVLIACIGHENVDVALVRGPDLLFARNLSGGSRLFDEAIAERFGVGERKAEEIKVSLATLEPGAAHGDANREKASRAILGAAGQLLSLLQSTVMFCKSQVKVAGLRVDRVLLCGGGARLRGLPAYLSSGMGVPVEPFDAFRVVDTQRLDPGVRELLEEYREESVVALGLATMASDPEAYSIEILPAGVRRKRELLSGPAWLWAAAGLALLFLVAHGWLTSRSLGRVGAEATRLEAQVRRATSTDRRVRELLDESAELDDTARELFALAGSGEQLARALLVLGETLPSEFWLTGLESRWSFDPELAVERGDERPIVRLEGRAREGTESAAAVYEGFLTALRAGLPGALFKHRPSPSGEKFTIDLTLLAPADDPGGAADVGGAGDVHDDGGDGGSDGGSEPREEG